MPLTNPSNRFKSSNNERKISDRIKVLKLSEKITPVFYITHNPKRNNQVA